MLGALVLSALALSVPHAGHPYVAYKHVGAGDFSCSGLIGGKPVPVRYQKSGGTTSCVFGIPKRTAGKVLVWTHSVRRVTMTRSLDGQGWDMTVDWEDGVMRRVVIRR